MTFMKEEYKPLPSIVYLAESTIEGFDIFAQDIIPYDTVIGVTHVAHDSSNMGGTYTIRWFLKP